MEIELVTSACCLPGLSRAELFAAVRRAGYRGVEVFPGWTKSAYDVRGEPADAFRGEGARVSAFHLPGKPDQARRAVELAAEAGVPQLIAHGAGEPAKAGEWLKPTVAAAREREVGVVVTNHKGQSIESPDDVQAVLDACGACAPAVLLEAGQFWAAGHDAREALKRFRDRVELVHVKDLDAQGRSVPFGSGVSPLAEFIEDLLAGGYQGRITVELELKETPAEEVIRLLSEARWKLAEWLGVSIAS